MTEQPTEPTATPLLQLDRARKDFGRKGGWFRGTDTRLTAVDDVSFSLQRGESFGLVGESGSGKTTLGRLVVRFERPTSGKVWFEGRDVNDLRGRDLKRFRRRVQMIFQNPFSSLNPRRSVRDTLAAGYAIHRIASGKEREVQMAELMERVGLRPDMLDRYPHEFSGGQRQRVVIARALSVGPDFVIADEPVSALDVSIQAQILNLMKSLQEDFRLTYLMITHDLRVVSFFCSRIGVMYLGRLVETGPRDAIVSRALHPYTRALISSAPMGDTRRRVARSIVRGEIPSGHDMRHGCVFSDRCWLKQALDNPDRCEAERPALREVERGRFAACHFAEATQASLADTLEGSPPLVDPAVPAEASLGPRPGVW